MLTNNNKMACKHLIDKVHKQKWRTGIQTNTRAQATPKEYWQNEHGLKSKLLG